MQWFWEIIEEMTLDQQRKFLKFVTSCSRQPLLGFRSLSPLACISQIRLSDEEQMMDAKEIRLPTSATCMNMLKLPNYKSKEIMRAKLLYAIESGAGFELS
jgi:ubiquitin-protein ligase E3 C